MLRMGCLQTLAQGMHHLVRNVGRSFGDEVGLGWGSGGLGRGWGSGSEGGGVGPGGRGVVRGGC